MLYLYLDKNHIKLLYVKKTLLGQYENAVYEKKHQIELLNKGQVMNNDLLASAIKEAVTFISSPPIKDKEVCLILPQHVFHFLRTEVPKDITPASVTSFLKDKVKAKLSLDLEDCIYDFFMHENDEDKSIIVYALEKKEFQKYNEAFNLINLQIKAVIPDALCYYKLFEKTLRKDKKEHIFYTLYEKDQLITLFYDSEGPVVSERIIDEPVKDPKSIEKILKTTAGEYEEKFGKINRLVLSGEYSDTVRQDTFTKSVGVWTNPLKRILPEFYAEYLKLLMSPSKQQVPYLKFDVCIGAFIFFLENRDFSLLKKRMPQISRPSMRTPTLFIPWKEISLFVGSFILSFIVLTLLSRSNMPSFFALQKKMDIISPTPTVAPPTNTPSPTPAIDKKQIKIKILNGSGTKGKAAEIKTILQKAGYEEILTGNADNFDYTQTEIQTKASLKDVGDVLKNDLKDYVNSPKITSLSENDTADVILIFGTDFK